ncbi:MAG: clostripain-related cysteine peptidase [Clostridia bacterium]|nr:clostripain-related cysteine peptidase [Clostridia bacterium]
MENQYQPAPKKKGGFLKVLLIILGVIVLLCLVFFVIGLFAADEEETAMSDAPQPAGTQQAAAQHEAAQPSGDGESWTVLLYLCGTDLESENGMCSQNLWECAQVELPENVNLLVCTGGTAAWQTDFIDPDYIQYHRIFNMGEFETLESLPLSSMGQPSTLGDFLRYGVENFPADNYGAVLWNHGGGMSGVAFDELHDADSLSIAELGEGFSTANASFEFIGFDACLMATLEGAMALSPYGNYMVASEEVEPGSGWDYTAMLDYIAANPQATGAEVGKVICDAYMAKCGAWGESCTLSVTDLSKVQPLAKAFDVMAGEMTLDTGDVNTFRALKQGIARAESYGGNTDAEGYFNLVDIGDMVMNAQSVLADTGDDVLDALFGAVVYNVSGSARANANGLATFYPIKAGNRELDNYVQSAAFSKNYLSYLSASRKGWKAPSDFVGADFSNVEAAAPDATVADADYSVDAETWLNDDGSFVLDIKDGADYIEGVYFSLYQMDYAYNEYMFLGRDDDLNVSDDLLQYTDNFRGVWPALNGVFVNLNLLESTDDYNLYSIPINLNGEQMNLRARYNWATESYQVLGAVAGAGDNGFSARKERMLKDGDVIQVLMTGQNWESGEESVYSVGEFTVSGSVTLEETPLTDGDYLYQYEMDDVLGDTYYSAEVIMECKDGEISVYETEEE